MVRQKLEYKNQVLVIRPEETPESPRDTEENLGTMVCSHSKYALGDVQTEFTTVQEYLESEEISFKEIAVIMPLYLYDHSGISMSCGKRLGQYNDSWDSSCVGFIYATKEEIRKQWSTSRISKQLKKHVTEILESEVKTYNQYLTGDVYEFTLYTKESCSLNETHLQVVECCGGFYGDCHEESGLAEHIEGFANFEETS